MKILRIIARLNVGGPARHVVWLTSALQDDEFQSSLVAGTVPEGEEDMAYFAAEHGVEPIYIAELSRELSPKDAVSLFKIYRELRSQSPDIVHTHTAKAGTVGRIAAFLFRWGTWGTLAGRPRRVTVIHTFHGHVFHSYYGALKTRIFITIEKVLARFATDRIITISDQQFGEIHEQFGVGRREQFRVIPLGIEIPDIGDSETKRRILRDEIGASDDEIVVGYVGRLTEIKNLRLLLEAAAQIQTIAGDGPQMRFAIIGDGHLRPQLEREATALGVDGIISFLGNRQNIGDLIAGLDIVALTSLNEGTPLSLIEGLSAGVPFVSTAVGGVVDLAGDTLEECPGFRVCQRGILVTSGQAVPFADGLIYLAKDEKLREVLSTNGREFIASSYSKDRLVNDIKSLYRELV